MAEPFGNSVRVIGFESYSDEDGNGLEGIGSQAEDDFRLDQAHDDDTSIRLCWDSLQLDDDHRETNEDFEWEEVDGLIGEREVLNMVLGHDDEGPIQLFLVGEPAEVDVEREENMGIALCHGLIFGIHALFVVMNCLQMILSMSKGETEELVASE